MTEKEEFNKIKDEIRILGLDDGSFSREDSETLLVGTIYRGGKWLDGVISTDITVDGWDATEKTIKMIKNSKYEDLRLVMSNGITVAGFNILDIDKIYDETQLPVIIFMEQYPDINSIKNALKNLEDWEKRFELIKNTGRIFEGNLEGKIYFQASGISNKDAEKIIKISSTRGDIPEPLRSAHIISTGITNMESTKR